MTALLWAAAGAAALAWLVILPREPQGWVRALKVVPAVLLAAVLGTTSIPLGAAFLLYATGDALLLDKARFFMGGLVAFLVGHLVLAGTVMTTPGAPVSPVLAGAALVVSAGMCAVLWPGLKGVLRVAVPVYALGLVALTATVGAVGPAALAGCLVFLLSDAILGFQKFRRKLPGGDLGVMVTYYGAIFLIALTLSGGVAPGR